MRLLRIMEHMKTQNWFAVVLDFVIVVLGVGVAMYGQQWLSDRQQRADLEKAEIAIQEDLFVNYVNAKERLALVDCRAESYKSVAAKLLEPGENWTGIARLENKDYRTVLPVVFRSPGRTWGSRSWQAEVGRGTFNQMSDERRAALGGILSGDGLQLLQTDIHTLQSRLNILAVNTSISRSDRLHYYELLTELDVKSGTLELISEGHIQSIEEIGIQIPAKYRQGISEYVSSIYTQQKDVYGECVKEQEFPALEAYLKKAKTP